MPEEQDLGEQLLAEAQAAAKAGIPPPVVSSATDPLIDTLEKVKAVLEALDGRLSKIEAHFKNVLHVDL
jgi:hypothetical protein